VMSEKGVWGGGTNNMIQLYISHSIIPFQNIFGSLKQYFVDYGIWTW
jgi:hypothetical protein